MGKEFQIDPTTVWEGSMMTRGQLRASVRSRGTQKPFQIATTPVLNVTLVDPPKPPVVEMAPEPVVELDAL